jgi:hypothetical protein
MEYIELVGWMLVYIGFGVMIGWSIGYREGHKDGYSRGKEIGKRIWLQERN